MTVSNYIQQISEYHASGQAREHSYRPHLQMLLTALLPNVMVVNEPKRQTVGAPDFILTDKKTKIPISYIETKDIGADLDSKAHKEQFDRYKNGLDILLITDYMEFRLYRRATLVQTVRIAELKNGKVVACSNDMFQTFEATVDALQHLLTGDLVTKQGVLITIRSAEDLAARMAQKARLLADVLHKALAQGDTDFEMADASLQQQFKAFQKILISDISYKDFADLYAQTITYGMFAARLHDKTLDDFSRQEAATLIPKSNPFLRKLFQYIASNDLDDRIDWMIDELAEVFRFTDVKAILSDFDKKTDGADPMIHFYETFLANYDPSLRKARGVWYTPEPVVNFIVRAVDTVLKTDFALKDGLADISKTTIAVKVDTSDKKAGTTMTVKREVHRVQVLDPATGTGTFLAEAVKLIHKKFKNQAGIWNNYVEKNLVPRLHGFELLMASYAMAHIKIDMLLRETGFTLERKNRLNIFLTNALEEHHNNAVTLFGAQWLTDEAEQADAVKRDAPIMVVMGNPPYSGESSNNGIPFIEKLMNDYKQEPSGGKLQEKNSKWINDDYVKFIRFGQYHVEKNGTGVLAFINPHGFLDNPTFRGMRYNLLKAFDTIYTIDLHGNAKKKETAPDGSADQNVFDIMQGVSINIFIKTGKKAKNDLAEVLHYDLYGKREHKYNFLQENSLKSIDFQQLILDKPQYFFVPKNFEVKGEYEKGFYLLDIFIENSLGVLSKNDDLTISFDKLSLQNRIKKLMELSEKEAKIFFNLKEDSRDWILSKAIQDLKDNTKEENYQQVLYRPFDNRWTFFTGRPKGFFAYSQNRIMKNLRNGDNYALISGRQGQAVGSMQWNLSFISNSISDQNIYYRGGGSVFPLYLYTSDLLGTIRTPNINEKIANKIVAGLGLTYVPEKTKNKNELAPIDILDYIYAVLHTPSYREKYKEFLKIDFPRVPYPSDKKTFEALVKLGSELRQYHLLTHDDIDDYITGYPQGGDNTVGKPKYENGKVWINGGQYFEGVSETVWNFYIGGYQPAQKWLKDRQGRRLDYEEVIHYQRIILALHHTERIMQALDDLYLMLRTKDAGSVQYE